MAFAINLTDYISCYLYEYILYIPTDTHTYIPIPKRSASLANRSIPANLQSTKNLEMSRGLCIVTMSIKTVSRNNPRK